MDHLRDILDALAAHLEPGDERAADVAHVLLHARERSCECESCRRGEACGCAETTKALDAAGHEHGEHGRFVGGGGEHGDAHEAWRKRQEARETTDDRLNDLSFGTEDVPEADAGLTEAMTQAYLRDDHREGVRLSGLMVRAWADQWSGLQDRIAALGATEDDLADLSGAIEAGKKGAGEARRAYMDAAYEAQEATEAVQAHESQAAPEEPDEPEGEDEPEEPDTPDLEDNDSDRPDDPGFYDSGEEYEEAQAEWDRVDRRNAEKEAAYRQAVAAYENEVAAVRERNVSGQATYKEAYAAWKKADKAWEKEGDALDNTSARASEKWDKKGDALDEAVGKAHAKIGKAADRVIRRLRDRLTEAVEADAEPEEEDGDDEGDGKSTHPPARRPPWRRDNRRGTGKALDAAGHEHGPDGRFAGGDSDRTVPHERGTPAPEEAQSAPYAAPGPGVIPAQSQVAPTRGVLPSARALAKGTSTPLAHDGSHAVKVVETTKFFGFGVAGKFVVKDLATEFGGATDAVGADMKAVRETAMSDLKRRMGLPAPAVMKADVGGKPCVVSEFAEGVELKKMQPAGRDAAIRKAGAAEVHTHALLDWVTSSTDRNLGNYMQSPDGRLVSLDHEASFQDEHNVDSALAMHALLWNQHSESLRQKGEFSLIGHVLAVRALPVNPQAVDRVLAHAADVEHAAAQVAHAAGHDTVGRVRQRLDALRRLKTLDAPTFADLEPG